MIGFVSTVFGANFPWILALQYIALIGACGSGLYVIGHGLILELPARITDRLSALTERIAQRFATS